MNHGEKKNTGKDDVKAIMEGLEKEAGGALRIVEKPDHEVRVTGKNEALRLLGSELKMFSPDDSSGNAGHGRFILVSE